MTSAYARHNQFRQFLELVLDDPSSQSAVSSTILRRLLAADTRVVGPPTTAPNTFKMVYKWTNQQGAKAANVLWGMDPIFTGIDTQMAPITSAMQTAISLPTGILTCISPDWQVTSIEAYDNTGATNNFSVVPVAIAGTYTGTGEPLPPNCAMVTSWDINEKYKGGHPRTYWPGVTNGMMAQAGAFSFTAAFITALKAAAIAFLGALISHLSTALSSAEVGTMSRFANKQPRPAAVFKPYGAGQVAVHSRLDSQRRRLGKEPTSF